MTKIEMYLQAKADASTIAAAAIRALGRDSSQNDKHRFSCEFITLVDDQWSPMMFYIRASYGYYGSSSGHSCTSNVLGKYLSMAIETNAAMLLDCATALAMKGSEKARLAAEQEARDVLTQTASTAA